MKIENYCAFKLLHERKQWKTNKISPLRLSDDKLTPSSLETKLNNSKISAKLKTATIFKTFPFFKPKSDKQICTPKSIVDAQKFKEKRQVKVSRVSASNCSISDDFSIKKLAGNHIYQSVETEVWPTHPLAKKLNTYFGYKREPALLKQKTVPYIQIESRDCEARDKRKNCSLLSINSETLLLNKRQPELKPKEQIIKLRSKSVNSGHESFRGEPERATDTSKPKLEKCILLKKVERKLEAPASLSPKNFTIPTKRSQSSLGTQARLVKNVDRPKDLSGRLSPKSLFSRFPVIKKTEYEKIANDSELLGPQKIELVLGLLEQSQPETPDVEHSKDENPLLRKSSLPHKKDADAKQIPFLASLEEIKEDEKEDDDFEITLRNNLNKKSLANNSATHTKRKFSFLNSLNRTRLH